ncbi:hypothetical protein COB55_05800 [Candidatus Wolfebacteria bacterium]|nr:MAG: hypothetical protein COB55_05800 [Candidatus Wolfebacteria bacterium]
MKNKQISVTVDTSQLTQAIDKITSKVIEPIVLTMKRDSFVKLMLASKGAEFVTIWTRTKTDLKKTNNPFATVKESVKNCIIGFDYTNSVNNQRNREEIEEIFFPKERKWGQRINNRIVTHKGNFYLTAKIEKTLEMNYVTETGENLTKDQYIPFLPKRSKDTTQGVEKLVKYNDTGLSSILAIKMRGQMITLTG